MGFQLPVMERHSGRRTLALKPHPARVRQGAHQVRQQITEDLPGRSNLRCYPLRHPEPQRQYHHCDPPHNVHPLCGRVAVTANWRIPSTTADDRTPHETGALDHSQQLAYDFN